MKKYLRNYYTGNMYEITRETKTQYICEKEGHVIIRAKKKVREDNGTLVYIVGHLKFDRPMTLIIRNDDAKET